MVFRERPMLKRAAAAMREVFADRRCPLVARFVHVQEMPAVGMAADGLHRYRLARQRVGHIDGPARRIGDAIAAMAETGDGEAFGHETAPSRNSALPSPPVIGEGIMPATRQPSETTNAAMSSRTAACTAASRTIPFLSASRPASNYGLISATACAGGFTSASAAGSTSLSEMKLASMTTRSGGSSRRAGESVRMS